LAGNSFPKFLSNLDNLHVRIGNSYPNLKPPVFFCKEIDGNIAILEYHSSREGLSPLVIGLLQGLGKTFQRSIEIDHVVKREDKGYDEFLIKHFPLSSSESAIVQVDSKSNIISNTKTNKQVNGRKQCPFSGG